LGLVGCYQPINIDLPDQQAQVVVNTTLTPDSTFNLSLVRTNDVLGPKEAELISDADISVFESGELIAQLTLPANGEDGNDVPIFRHDSRKPMAGGTYDLQIDIENAKTITSTTTIPEEVRLSDVEIDEFRRWPDFQDRDFDNIVIKGRLLIDNPKAGDHFYHFAQAQLFLDWYDVISGDTTITDVNKDSILIPIENADLGNNSYTSLLHEPGFLIMDKDEGGIYEVVPFQITTRINHNYQLLNHLKVFIRHTSKDYFKFHQSVTNQLIAKENAFAEPVRPHSNIVNGQGHFSGYSRSYFTHKFK